MSNDILIRSLRPSVRRPYAIVSVASHPRRKNQKARVGPAGQTGVCFGGSKIGKTFLAVRGAKEREETPWDSRRTGRALAMRQQKEAMALLGVGQNWSGTFFLGKCQFRPSAQVSLKVHAFASLQVSEPIAELLDCERTRPVALACRLLRSAAATRARSTRLVRCVKRPPRTP